MKIAVNRGDAEDYARVYADDASITIYGTTELIYSQPFVGKPAALEWFRIWATAIRDPSSKITTIMSGRDVVLMETIVRGTLDGTLGTISASQKLFEIHRAVIVQLKDREIIHIRSFINAKELAESVGEWPPKTSAGRDKRQ